jgi:hypothetical protein
MKIAEGFMRFIGLGIAAILALSSPAHAAWQTYTVRDQGFSIESPVPLTQGTGVYRGAVAGRLDTITYSGALDGISYKVSVIDISKRIPDAVNIFLEMEFLTPFGAKVIGNDSVGIEPGANRHYGRQLVYVTKEGNQVRTTLIYNKGKIYTCEAIVPANGDKDSILPERFADSILFDLDGAARERDADPKNFTTPDGK